MAKIKYEHFANSLFSCYFFVSSFVYTLEATNFLLVQT